MRGRGTGAGVVEAGGDDLQCLNKESMLYTGESMDRRIDNCGFYFTKF